MKEYKFPPERMYEGVVKLLRKAFKVARKGKIPISVSVAYAYGVEIIEKITEPAEKIELTDDEAIEELNEVGFVVFFEGKIESKREERELAERVAGFVASVLQSESFLISVRFDSLGIDDEAYVHLAEAGEVVQKERKRSEKKTEKRWESGMRVYDTDSFRIVVPEKIFKVCKAIANKYPDVEFSILCKAKREGDVWRVSEEFFVPDQEVTSGSVDFKDKTQLNGWNCIIHKHPSGLETFSHTDMETINSNNEVSLLFCDGRFTDAIANIRLSEDEKLRLRIPPERIEIDSVSDIEIEGLDRIKVRESYSYSRYYGGYWEKGGDRRWRDLY